ncbi:hypothetical protein BY996DRAFT_6535494 [Phakopsora pachyrhizi]|nr:hypothetical protein BY996DRAFT_6535494 [Phakopsora pachyrhizi]
MVNGGFGHSDKRVKRLQATYWKAPMRGTRMNSDSSFDSTTEQKGEDEKEVAYLGHHHHKRYYPLDQQEPARQRPPQSNAAITKKANWITVVIKTKEGFIGHCNVGFEYQGERDWELLQHVRFQEDWMGQDSIADDTPMKIYMRYEVKTKYQERRASMLKAQFTRGTKNRTLNKAVNQQKPNQDRVNQATNKAKRKEKDKKIFGLGLKDE